VRVELTKKVSWPSCLGPEYSVVEQRIIRVGIKVTEGGRSSTHPPAASHAHTPRVVCCSLTAAHPPLSRCKQPNSTASGSSPPSTLSHACHENTTHTGTWCFHVVTCPSARRRTDAHRPSLSGRRRAIVARCDGTVRALAQARTHQACTGQALAFGACPVKCTESEPAPASVKARLAHQPSCSPPELRPDFGPQGRLGVRAAACGRPTSHGAGCIKGSLCAEPPVPLRPCVWRPERHRVCGAYMSPEAEEPRRLCAQGSRLQQRLQQRPGLGCRRLAGVSDAHTGPGPGSRVAVAAGHL
jgi:hypothetical protein